MVVGVSGERTAEAPRSQLAQAQLASCGAETGGQVGWTPPRGGPWRWKRLTPSRRAPWGSRRSRPSGSTT
jgi:hypothetical protein